MTDTSEISGRHSAPDPPVAPQSFRAELRDAISPRAAGLVFGVLILQLGFILSYVGAFHAPSPHRLELVVAAPAQVSSQLISTLNGLAGQPVHAIAVADEQAARSKLHDGTAPAALVVVAQGSTDALLVASAAGTSTATAVEAVVTQVEQAQKRTVKLTDIVPLQAGDGRGLTGFYLVIGWIVGGYLVAALLGVAGGARPATSRRGVIRLASMVPYAVLSGLGGAIVVGPVLGAIDGHFWPLSLLGALLVFAAAAVTMAFQVLFGVIGIGVTVLVFVVLGNPSAGGAYQPALLPPFWRAISDALPNGAGTAAVRHIVYFGSHGIGEHLIVITSYAVVGSIIALMASVIRTHLANRVTG